MPDRDDEIRAAACGSAGPTSRAFRRLGRFKGRGEGSVQTYGEVIAQTVVGWSAAARAAASAAMACSVSGSRSSVG